MVGRPQSISFLVIKIWINLGMCKIKVPFHMGLKTFDKKLPKSDIQY